MTERNESEEPKSVPQEQIRELSKASEDFIVAEKERLDSLNDLPAADEPQVMDDMAGITALEVPELQANPLAPPAAASGPVQDVLETPLSAPGQGLPRQQRFAAKAIDDMARIAQEQFGPPPKPEPQRLPTAPPQAKRAETAAVMADMAQVAAEQVPDAQPVNPAQMPRGEMERLTFKQDEGADSLVEAYKAYLQEDKDWRATLARLLRNHASEIRQQRLELDQVRCLTERDRY